MSSCHLHSSTKMACIRKSLLSKLNALLNPFACILQILVEQTNCILQNYQHAHVHSYIHTHIHSNTITIFTLSFWYMLRLSYPLKDLLTVKCFCKQKAHRHKHTACTSNEDADADNDEVKWRKRKTRNGRILNCKPGCQRFMTTLCVCVRLSNRMVVEVVAWNWGSVYDVCESVPACVCVWCITHTWMHAFKHSLIQRRSELDNSLMYF